MKRYKFLAIFITLSILMNLFNVPSVIADDVLKQKIIVVKEKETIESKLKKTKYVKIKQFNNMSNTTLVMISDSDARKLEQSDPNVKVYDECSFKVPIKKLNKKRGNHQTIPWGIRKIGANSAWKETTGKKVKVAVIDSGIDIDHLDLIDNFKGAFL